MILILLTVTFSQMILLYILSDFNNDIKAFEKFIVGKILYKTTWENIRSFYFVNEPRKH